MAGTTKNKSLYKNLIHRCLASPTIIQCQQQNESPSGHFKACDSEKICYVTKTTRENIHANIPHEFRNAQKKNTAILAVLKACHFGHFKCLLQL